MNAIDNGAAGTAVRSRGRWFGALAMLVLLTEQTALGFQLVAPAMPQIAAKYETTQIIWVITAFTLTGGVVTPIIGKLSDKYGKRFVLSLTAVVAFIGSVISALAPNFEVLLIGRAISGVASAFLPVAYALIRDVFPKDMRDVSIGIATNGIGVVTIAGPFIAGFLIDNISMESVFWFVAILSAVGAAGTIWLVPETDVRDESSIDYIGAVLVAIGGFALLLGTSQIENWGIGSAKTLGLLIGGVVVLVAWWFWEKRVDDPFIVPELLSTRSTATVIFAFAFASAVVTVIASYLPTFLQIPRELGIDYGFGVDATGVARYLVVPGILTVLGGLVVGFGAKKYGFRSFLIAGSAMMIVGSVFLSIFTSDWWGPVIGYGMIAIGAMVNAAGPGLLMLLAPVHQRGVAAGMMGSLTAVVGSLFAQFAGLVLSQNIGQVAGGMPVYTIDGVRYVFYLAAAMGVIAVIIALLVPRTAAQLSDDGSVAATVAA